MNASSQRALGISRRQLLAWSARGLSLGAAGLLPLPSLLGCFGRAATRPTSSSSNRILVIFEISGGNDGLNTVIPYGDDAYYRHRPAIGIPTAELIALDEHFGLSRGMQGFERLFKDGELAIIHGCGYEDPSFSHGSSMAYWHTGEPHSGSEYGWVGRTADALVPGGASNSIVNVGARQSLAVRSRDHRPVVFDDPYKFKREHFFQERTFFEGLAADASSANASQRFLREMVGSARAASACVAEAWANYRSPVDYGLSPYDLDKVAALIEADFPARLYYAGVRNSVFDTHVYQRGLHERLLTYVSDAVAGFLRDMQRIGRSDDVVIILFSEFGRRVPENANLGTDHGAAGLMFVAGKPVAGGHHGEPPSLTELDEGDNLVYTTDFRRVYASAIEGWLQHPDASQVLGERFDALPLFV